MTEHFWKTEQKHKTRAKSLQKKKKKKFEKNKKMRQGNIKRTWLNQWVRNHTEGPRA